MGTGHTASVSSQLAAMEEKLLLPHSLGSTKQDPSWGLQTLVPWEMPMFLGSLTLSLGFEHPLPQT